MEIEFRKRKRLRILFYSIIIDVSKINEAFGSLEIFAREYDITGVTNGELLIMYFMTYPGEYYDYLISDVFEPYGFAPGKDHILIQEELRIGVERHPVPVLNHPISDLQDNSWLGSIVNKKGNWLWKND